MSVNLKRAGVFLILVFLLGWGLEFYVLFTGGQQSEMYDTMMTLILFLPALSVLMVRVSTGEGFSDALVKPRFLGHVLAYVLAYFASQVMVFAGVSLYYILYPGNLDMNLTAFGQELALQAQMAGITDTMGPEMIQDAAFYQLFMGLFLSPVLNILFGFGMEFGWRGYLLPKLCERFSNKVSMLISGALWGIWYAPLVVMGYGYGTDYAFYPFGGILAMIALCILFGAFLSYLTLRAGSVIPAAIASAGMQGVASLGMILFQGEPTPFLGPLPTGILGGFGVLIVGILCFVIVDRYSFKGSVTERVQKEREKEAKRAKKELKEIMGA